MHTYDLGATRGILPLLILLVTVADLKFVNSCSPSKPDGASALDQPVPSTSGPVVLRIESNSESPVVLRIESNNESIESNNESQDDEPIVTSSFSLKRAISESESEPDETFPPLEEKKEDNQHGFTCPYCSLHFNEKNQLDEHKKKHDRLCDICGKNIRNFQYHYRIHHKIKKKVSLESLYLNDTNLIRLLKTTCETKFYLISGMETNFFSRWSAGPPGHKIWWSGRKSGGPNIYI